MFMRAWTSEFVTFSCQRILRKDLRFVWGIVHSTVVTVCLLTQSIILHLTVSLFYVSLEFSWSVSPSSIMSISYLGVGFCCMCNWLNLFSGSHRKLSFVVVVLFRFLKDERHIPVEQPPPYISTVGLQMDINRNRDRRSSYLQNSDAMALLEGSVSSEPNTPTLVTGMSTCPTALIKTLRNSTLGKIGWAATSTRLTRNGVM